MNRNALISDMYRCLNAQLHIEDCTYGTTAKIHVDDVRAVAIRYNVRTILDYGCGKQLICSHLGDEFHVQNYDPAIAGLDSAPEPAELVTCIDMLEHVEPVFLENVLADLGRLAQRVGLLTIATKRAGKTLPDGTNCHRIVQSRDWWIERLTRHFHVNAIEQRSGDALRCLVSPTAQ